MTTQLQDLLAMIFSQGGILSHTLKDYEERTCQKEMALNILNAYENNRIALIEAGTGTGKSLAYLVPAVYWGLKEKEKTVISTHTIALQEQLLLKDIPFLLKTLDENLKVCLVKGMSNYLCLRKLRELQDQPLLFSLEEAKHVQQLENWSERTREGSKSDIPFSIAPSTWEKVAADGSSCNHVKCPHYKQCFFFKARKNAEDAQILIVNHHLLLADIEKKRRNLGQESILPSYNRLIIDEAHHLEDIALEIFAQKFDAVGFLRYLSKLFAESNPERSRATLLKQQLSVFSAISPRIIQKLEIDIPAQKMQCQTQLDAVFAELFFLFDRANSQKETKIRITDAHTQSPGWQKLTQALIAFSEEVHRLFLLLTSLLMQLEEYKDAQFYDKLSLHLLEIQAIGQYLDQTHTFLQNFVQDEPKEKRVRWIEKNGSNALFVDAALDVSTFLKEALFSTQQTSILCSATMATAQSFSFMKKRLGLSDETMQPLEEIYHSPFDYSTQTLLAVPTDLPIPSHPTFLAQCVETMREIIEISKGSIFLLFTSYDMLQNAYRSLAVTDLSDRFPFLKQGDLPRHVLLEQFKQTEGSVLFATDSFWEGVDVPGEALRCVVMVKLPFFVPSDPLYQAYSESLEQEGLDPFFDYSVPQAVIKFKQGFGRLMRKKEDRGCVVCLDQRLVKKHYGKQFLASLPECKTSFAPAKEVFVQMRQFFARTAPKR